MNFIQMSVIGAMFVTATMSVTMAHEEQNQNTVEVPKIEDLMTSILEGAKGMEVILSRVTLPPNVALPKHWHG